MTAVTAQAAQAPPPIDAAEAEPVLQVKGLISRFGDHVVHDGVDLEVRRGEIFGLVGGSGSGKSVLLNALIGLRRPDGGEVKVFGVDPYGAGSAERRALESRWGVLFQGGALFSALSVRDNVAAPMREHTRLPANRIDDLADMKIRLSGLADDAGDLRPSELSGGMRKRAGLARALSMDPELLFLDEPTAGLDPIGADQFDKLIRNLSENLGLTIFMITHDLDTLYALCDRVAVIADKKIAAVGPISELERSEHPWIQDYFLGPRGRAASQAAVAAEEAPERAGKG
jgi:phospholipid/cholesterol/gamma-HCH transport system ATP-binding protein